MLADVPDGIGGGLAQLAAVDQPRTFWIPFGLERLANIWIVLWKESKANVGLSG